MNILNTGFEDYSDPDLLTKANAIYQTLGTAPASTTYAAVEPSMIDLQQAIDGFEATVGIGNNPAQVELRAQKRGQLITVLELMAVNLESITPGNRVDLSTTGYTLRKIPVRDSSPTGIPENVGAKPTGNQGEAKLSASAVSHATAYEGRATQDLAAGPFVSCPPSSGVRGLLFTGLERGKDWFFQIRAIGPNGVGPWSDPAMMMVV